MCQVLSVPVDQLSTRATLLVRMRDPEDERAWAEFVELYAPIMYNFVAKRGLQKADVEDVVQNALRAFAGAIQRFEYDPEKGTFRSWLFRVLRTKLADHYRKLKVHEQGTGRSTVMRVIEETPSESEEADWDTEYHQHVFQWAVKRVRPQVSEQTWQAFWMTAVSERDAGEVAKELGMERGAVYVAKSRVIARMKRAVESIAGELGES